VSPSDGAWTSRSESALTRFSRTETASATALLVAVVAALAWAGVDSSGYAEVWHTHLSIELGTRRISLSLSDWINSGLMTLFFFVVGLEARREFDMGELRERGRVIAPVLAGVGGMAGAVALYLLVAGGDQSARGWGVAMSTDTAFALGTLALVGAPLPRTAAVVPAGRSGDRRHRRAGGVIATVYTERVEVLPLLVAAVLFAVIIGACATSALLRVDVLRARRRGLGGVVTLRGGSAGDRAGDGPVRVRRAGRDDGPATGHGSVPGVSGANPPTQLARAAAGGLRAAVSPNERLREGFHR